MILDKHRNYFTCKLFLSRYLLVFMPAKAKLERQVLEMTKPFYDVVSTDIKRLTTYDEFWGFLDNALELSLHKFASELLATRNSSNRVAL